MAPPSRTSSSPKELEMMYGKKMPPSKAAGKAPAFKPCAGCKAPAKCKAAGKCMDKAK